MDYREVLNVVLPTFVAIIIGYIFGKFIKLDLTGFNQIIFYIGLPTVAFVSISSQKIVLADAGAIWASNIIVTAGCAAIALLVFKLKKEKHSGLYLPISLANTINIPFPVISLAYGAPGLVAAVLYYIPNTLIMNSLGIFVAAGKSPRENLKTMFRVPTIYAAFLALALNLLHVTIPQAVLRPISFISGMVIPAVVLTLGYSLSRIKITALPTTLLSSVIRMGGGLVLGYLMARLFGLTGILRSVVILVSAMPAAMNTYMLAAMYNNEEELVASVVFVTTVASLFVIPILLRIL